LDDAKARRSRRACSFDARAVPGKSLIRSTPPRPDEFEISVIGPGKGECVVIHLGDNEWCVVDSCRSRGQSESVALEYLSDFNNGADGRIKLIVATHWHDDHVRGLGSILKRAPNAAFYCPIAVQNPMFFQLVQTSLVGVSGQSGVDEFASVLQIIRDRKGGRKIQTPSFAKENCKLLDLTNGERSFPATVTALSPSDSTFVLALSEIAKLIPIPGDSQLRITSLDANNTSVVLWIEAGPVTALLGADLLHTAGYSDVGWNAVLNCQTYHRKAPFFKVPHHGSMTADCPEAWKKALAANPIAVVTPFNSSRLPRPADLARLATRTPNLHCTAKGAGKAPARDPIVDKTMRLEVKDRRVIEGLPGHVRVRWPLGSETPNEVEHFHGAYHYESDAVEP
jgi:beta-lactamase superfamily II metal-dependent hydrolase